MPADVVWICHQCGQQVVPHVMNGINVCPHCESDFLEEIDLVDDDIPEDRHDSLPDGFIRNMHEYGLSDDDNAEDDLPHLPGSFPSTSRLPESSGSATPPLTQRQRTQAPLFRMGVRGGSLTFGGGGGTPTDGRRSGRGAGFASSEPMLRTSYQEGVPTLSEFMAGLGAPARVRSPRSPPQQDPFASLFPSSRFANSPRAPAGTRQVDLGDVVGGLLGAFAGPSRAGNDDPYMALLRSQGGLGAFLGGGMLRDGQLGDFATSQEAFDHIVSNLAQAAGTSSNRPPPASTEMIDALPSVPISTILLNGLDPKECSICMSDFEVGETGRKMPCLHFFHDGCLRTWLESNGTCPVCRYSLVKPRSSAADPSSVPLPPSRSSTSILPDERPNSSASRPTADDGSSGSASPVRERPEPPVRRSGAAAGTGVRAEDE